MTKKLIIHYDGDPLDALKKVSAVVKMGRISEARGFKQFCFVTPFPVGMVIANHKHREGCDTFEVMSDELEAELRDRKQVTKGNNDDKTRDRREAE